MQKKKQVTQWKFKHTLIWARGIMLNARDLQTILNIGNYLAQHEVEITNKEILELREKVRNVYAEKKSFFSTDDEEVIEYDNYEETLCGRHSSEYLGGLELHYNMYYDIIDINAGVKAQKHEEYLARVNQYGIWKKRILSARTSKQIKFYAFSFMKQQKMQDFKSNIPAKYAARFWRYYRVKKAMLERKESSQVKTRKLVQATTKVAA